MASRGHSADDVARTALRILDDHGLPDLTMRRLATALEVQPSALYWHFPSKQSLLAELSDRIVGRMASGISIDLRTEAFSLRDALLAYRDGAEVVSSTLALGLGSTLAHDRLTAAAVHDGFDAATARRGATTVLHYVLGFVWHEQQRMLYDSVGARGGGAGAVGAGAVGAETVGAGTVGAATVGAGAVGTGTVGAETVGAETAGVRAAHAGAMGVRAAHDISTGGTGAGEAVPAGDAPAGLATDDFAFGLDLIAAGLWARGRV